MYLDNEENRLSVGTERRFEWRNLFKNLRFSGKYGRRHNCRFVFTPVTDFDQCEENHVESLQRHRPPGGQPSAELPAAASRSMRPSYSPHAVLSRSILGLSFVSLSQHLSWANLSARRCAPGVHLSTNVGHQGSMMIPLVPVIVSQNAYILYIRAPRFGDPVQGTAAGRYERQAAQSKLCGLRQRAPLTAKVHRTIC